MSYIPIIVSIFAIISALLLIKKINKFPSGSNEMTHISQAIRAGAVAFLKREYIIIAIASIFLFFVLFIFFGFNAGLGFLIGALFSGLAGFLGITISTKTNLKVAQALKQGSRQSFNLSFKGGSITGFLVVGFGLFSVSGFYLLTKDIQALIAFGFGCSLISIFTRLGGGIYTKAADIGADLVGKQEKDIPEDDPRNPAVIADLVGDNVGDCAGMATDLFETYIVTMVAVMALGSLIFPGQPIAILLPLYLGACALLSSIIASFFVRMKKGNKNIISAFYKGIFIAGILTAFSFFWVLKAGAFILDTSFLSFYLSSLAGLVVAGGLFLITDYYTSEKYSPVLSIVRASKTGHATNIITGLSVGMQSTVLPIILICIGIFFSFWLGGIYGLGICVVSMLSLIVLIIAMDSYGPIIDNASGIIQMSGEDNGDMRNVTDSLDSVGNTTKAVTKTYAIGSAVMASLILFSLYIQEIKNFGNTALFDLENYKVLIGLFIGGAIPYLFSSFVLTAVNKAGEKIIEEARRQFREIKGLMFREVKPEYGKCVDIATKASLKEMILPVIIPIIIPVAVGFILGPQVLGGLLIGSIITGFFMAVSMTTGGAAWDNAKKYIEKGCAGGKGSFAYQSAITGDTVGDAYKDTAGPAINPMIKILNIIALLIVGFLV